METDLRRLVADPGRSADRPDEPSLPGCRQSRTLAAMVGAMMLARAVDDEELAQEILGETLSGLS